MEQVGLVALVGGALLVAIALVAAGGPIDGGRQLGGTIARKMTCAPHLPDNCRHDPLIPAYGSHVARVVRHLAPDPLLSVREGLAPIDFRYCRRASCATPVAGERADRLTISNRRITSFTEVRDERRSGGELAVVYWNYRPGQPWERVERRTGPEEIEAAQEAVHLGRDETPKLVPLETLGGRNHVRFRKGEEPPWRWRVDSVYPEGAW